MFVLIGWCWMLWFWFIFQRDRRWRLIGWRGYRWWCVIKSIILTTFKCAGNYSSLLSLLASTCSLYQVWWRVSAGQWSYEGKSLQKCPFQGQPGATLRTPGSAELWWVVMSCDEWPGVLMTAPLCTMWSPPPQQSVPWGRAIVTVSVCHPVSPDHFTRLRRWQKSCLQALPLPLSLLVLPTIGIATCPSPPHLCCGYYPALFTWNEGGYFDHF